MIQMNGINQSNQITTSDLAAKNAIAATGNFSNVMKNKLQAPQTMDSIFQRASQKYGVPLNLLKAVGKAESDFDPKAVSKAGAQGVMQLMPGTAKELGVSDPFDPEQNIMGGAKYLRSMLDKYDGDAKLALAAYNAGANNVDKYNGIPPFKETQNYVVTVMNYAGRDLELPSYSTSSYGFQTAAATGSQRDAAANATAAAANFRTFGSNPAWYSQNISNNFGYGSFYGSNYANGYGNIFDSAGMDSQTTAMYNNLYNSMQQFQSYSKDDYLFFLEQLKLSLNPAKILYDTDDGDSGMSDYFLRSRLSYL